MNDYISRVMAIARLTKVEVTNKLTTMTDAKRVIAEMPAADVTPVVHGRWIGAPLCGNDNCRCSECGSWHNIHANLRGEPTQKYCPNCGAKMDGGDSDA